jgi:hypothetical protein
MKDFEYAGITVYFPNGQPAPIILTEQELITLLRLDTEGPQTPSLTLQYYRDKGLLRGIRVGKRIRYYLYDVLRFLELQVDWTNRKQIS